MLFVLGFYTDPQPYMELMLLTQRSLKIRFRAIWTSLLLTIPPHFAERLEFLTETVINESLERLELTNEIDLTIVAIAIGAYWHQDLQEVRSRILGLQAFSKADILELVLAYAIALACRGELKPQSFISQICHDFNKRRALSRDPESQRQCLGQLQLAQALVNQGASATAAHRLDRGLSAAIASSLYYFFSTTHSWSLTTEHARKHPLNNHQQVSIQSGAIAAAYLGELGNIEHNIGNIDMQSQQLLTKGSILGDRLWAEWAGIYNCEQ